MLKKSKVVMLPNNKKADDLRIGDMFSIQDINRIDGKNTISNKIHSLGLVKYGNHERSDLIGIGLDVKIQQHLYFFSDEEIKDGYILHNSNEIGKVISVTDKHIVAEFPNSGQVTCQRYNCQKIIATTDKSLTLQYIGSKLYDESKTPNYYGFKSGVGLNSHLKTVNLPQPSKSFLDVFVREYNKGNIINEVTAEYEKYNYKAEVVGGIWDGEFYEYNVRLKVNPKDNTITIKPVKDSWSREEVEVILRKLAADIDNEYRPHTSNNILGWELIEENKWIEQNL